MLSFFKALSEYDAIIDIVSCVFTVLALIFTLYFWLLDHLGEDEAKFIEGKEKFLKSLYKCLRVMDDLHSNSDLQPLLKTLIKVNNKLEVILNYRFWARSKKKEEYKKINQFHYDTRYLISTLQRAMEAQNAPIVDGSLINMPELEPNEIEDIKADYRKGLYYIIDFLENWS